MQHFRVRAVAFIAVSAAAAAAGGGIDGYRRRSRLGFGRGAIDRNTDSRSSVASKTIPTGMGSFERALEVGNHRSIAEGISVSAGDIEDLKASAALPRQEGGDEENAMSVLPIIGDTGDTSDTAIPYSEDVVASTIDAMPLPPTSRKATTTIPACSCSPQTYSIRLTLNQTCDVNDLNSNGGIGGTFCVFRSAEPLFTTDLSNATVVDVTFSEFRTDPGETPLFNTTLSDMELSDGDVITFDSITNDLNPEMTLGDQTQLVPGVVQLIMTGVIQVEESGEAVTKIVSHEVFWYYTNDCWNLPVAETDRIGWITMESVAPAIQDFCPVAPPPDPQTSLPSKSPSAGPPAGPGLALTSQPSKAPSAVPSAGPTMTLTSPPSKSPSAAPSAGPTMTPTSQPARSRSLAPSTGPTETPMLPPSKSPRAAPSSGPSETPMTPASKSPSDASFAGPTLNPTSVSSGEPSAVPSSALSLLLGTTILSWLTA